MSFQNKHWQDIYEKANNIIDKKKNNKNTKEKEYCKFLKKLELDYNLIIDYFVDYIKDKISIYLVKGYYQENEINKINIWHIYQIITDDLKNSLVSNVQVKTFFQGFWDKNKRCHNFNHFENTNIECLVIEKVNEIFEGTNIRVLNISDRNKSFNFVLQINF
uniref:Uncharacterized protein n=1 Tax=Florenciella sp. virus SA2 TaxID=3240092 RepID=A0AB39JEZ4_9VIRU